MMMWSGVVLAGGRSSRFGSDKARYIYKGKTLLAHTLDSLQGASEQFVIANTSYDIPVPIYQDVQPGSGPLSGLHAALSYAHYDWVALCACDMPHLSTDYWQVLRQYVHIKPDALAIIPQNAQGGLEPLSALYHRNLLSEVEFRLAEGLTRMQHIGQIEQVYVLPWSRLVSQIKKDILTNINVLSDVS